MLKFVVGFVLLVWLIRIAHGCNHRDYGNGASVCVCSDQLECDSLKLNISRVKGIVTSYRTTKAGDRFVRNEYQFAEILLEPLPDATIILNQTVKYQKIIGFGGTFTDATGINIAKLPARLQNRLIRDYFAEDGLEYRLARVPIGGTDFSTRQYSYDDGANDETLRSFSLQSEDLKYKIPYLKAAQKVSSQKLKYFANTWSPPAWMKDNGALSKGYLKGEPGGVYYKLFAKYLIRFFQEYSKNRINFWGLTVQNEPVFPAYINNSVNSLLMSATMQRDFIKMDLSPELIRSGFKNLEIMIFDENLRALNSSSNRFDEFAFDFVSTVLDDPEVGEMVSGIAFHWYFNRYTSRRAVLDQFAQKYSDKFLLSTEACIPLQGVVLGNWVNFDKYADDVIHDLNHHTSGWVDWNMVLDLTGGPSWMDNFVDAAIVVNETAKEYYKQPFYYALGHFSKLLVPDSVRIKHEVLTELDTENNFLVTIFERPDNSTVLTVLNKYNQTILLLVQDEQSGFLSIEIKANSLESLIWY